MTLPGFSYPGGPVNSEELFKSWARVYLVLMMLKSKDPGKARRISRIQDLLAEANELVSSILQEGLPLE